MKTVKDLKEYLSRFPDNVEVRVECWDKKTQKAIGSFPIVLMIDDTILGNEIILYGKELK